MTMLRMDQSGFAALAGTLRRQTAAAEGAAEALSGALRGLDTAILVAGDAHLEFDRLLQKSRTLAQALTALGGALDRAAEAFDETDRRLAAALRAVPAPAGGLTDPGAEWTFPPPAADPAFEALAALFGLDERWTGAAPLEALLADLE